MTSNPALTINPRDAGALTGEVFSPSDRKIIRMDAYLEARMIRPRPAPTVHMPPWMMSAPANDPNPPSSPAAQRAA